MKSFLITVVIILSFVLTPLFVCAANNPPQDENTKTTQVVSTPTKSTVQNPAEKLNRGIINIITAPIEIAKQINLSWKKSAKETKPVSTGIASGLVKGLANTVERAGSGLWDVVTFPFKTSKGYEPIMKPEFVLDEEK